MTDMTDTSDMIDETTGLPRGYRPAAQTRAQAAIDALEHHMACPDTLLPDDLQLANEHTFGRHHIARLIRIDLAADPELARDVHRGVERVRTWAEGVVEDGTYDTRAARMHALLGLDDEALHALVLDVLEATVWARPTDAHGTGGDKLMSVASQLHGAITRAAPAIDDRREAIMTAAEILAVLQDLGWYEITRSANARTEQVALMLVSVIALSERLTRFVDGTLFLPPLVCPPRHVSTNASSAYYTRTGSVLLGAAHHDMPVSLDVLNVQNAVPMRLNVDLLKAVPMRPKKEFTDPKSARNWQQFKLESVTLQAFLAAQTRGNDHRIWFENRYDSRGRCYSNGYHVNPQGGPHQKAALELGHAEIVTGVPDHLTTTTTNQEG